jgi:hypothetical protein
LARLTATAVSFCGNGGLESVFIWTLDPDGAGADATAPLLAPRAAIAAGETIARTPFEIPPGYR